MAFATRYSLRTSLVLLVAACLLPVVLVNAGLLLRQHEQRRELVQDGNLILARKVMADLERELSAIEGGLRVLATAEELARGDLQGFQQRAGAAIASGIVINYVLTDTEGRQRMNTLLPPGSPLPETGTPPRLAEVFSREDAVLSDFFLGPVTHRPTVAMGVPVRLADRVVYSLNMGLPVQRLSDLLTRQRIPEGRLVAVIDSSGVIVARSYDAERFVGQPVSEGLGQALRSQREGRLASLSKEGQPMMTVFTSSERWGWRVAVGAPESALRADLLEQLRQVGIALLSALVLGLLAASWIAGRVLSTVRGLNAAARRLQQGGRFEMPELQLREAEAVGAAMQQAARAMEQVKYLAQHDPLTGLANRLLFVELARHQLAGARRQQQSLALLALDLDGFKAVNDGDGHAAGDQVLKQAAQRLQGACRAADVVARIGGDEFMVLLGPTEVAQAEATATRILQALSQPYQGSAAAVSASIGLALFPRDGETLEQLMARADAALYAAKAAGKNRCVEA